jgi:hypothetical protein
MATKTKKTEGSANGATKTATKRKIVAQPETARAIKPTAPVKKLRHGKSQPLRKSHGK